MIEIKNQKPGTWYRGEQQGPTGLAISLKGSILWVEFSFATPTIPRGRDEWRRLGNQILLRHPRLQERYVLWFQRQYLRENPECQSWMVRIPLNKQELFLAGRNTKYNDRLMPWLAELPVVKTIKSTRANSYVDALVARAKLHREERQAQ